MDKRLSLLFQAPYTIAIDESPLPEPRAGEVLVTALFSAISPGTEMLFYRGQAPAGMAIDETIGALAGTVAYPLAYGYALVGTVTAVGRDVDQEWLGRLVFVFAPHQSHVICRPEDLLVVPAGLTPRSAVLLPFMETAVSFLMDGHPLIGERVLVMGQGIVGLLVTALLSDYPLGALITADPFPLRRDWSRRLGAHTVLDPLDSAYGQRLHTALQAPSYQGADLVFELSGNPQALDQAIAAAGFDGRIVVGSWYGNKTAGLDLGGHFHRNQIQLLSSQVSHIAPRWRGRFDKKRRMEIAWIMLARHQPERLITHVLPITGAAEAYRILDKAPETAVQVVLDYGNSVKLGAQG